MQNEAREQAALIEWTERVKHLFPEIKLLFHIPNGGSRNKLEACKLKRMGVRSGVSDVFLPMPKGGWCGLYIEMKAGKGKPTKNQLEFITAMLKQGYAAQVCTGFEAAKNTILQYLRGDLRK